MTINLTITSQNRRGVLAANCNSVELGRRRVWSR
jgi:hypothetical protein